MVLGLFGLNAPPLDNRFALGETEAHCRFSIRRHVFNPIPSQSVVFRNSFRQVWSGCAVVGELSVGSRTGRGQLEIRLDRRLGHGEVGTLDRA